MALEIKPDDLYLTQVTLIEKIKNWEDRVSWERFMKTYSPLVYSVALRAGLSNAEADDVVQDTMLSIAKNIREFQYDPAIGKFRNWVIKNTSFRVGDQFRRRKKLPMPRTSRTRNEDRTATIDRIPAPDSLNIEALCEEEWEKHIRDVAVQKIKDKINPKHYQVLDLHMLKNWPVPKVARTLGVTSAFVHLTRFRLIKILKKEVEALKQQAI
jgi:RNA polymerase sigma factor (sigma-70 family)